MNYDRPNGSTPRDVDLDLEEAAIALALLGSREVSLTLTCRLRPEWFAADPRNGPIAAAILHASSRNPGGDVDLASVVAALENLGATSAKPWLLEILRRAGGYVSPDGLERCLATLEALYRARDYLARARGALEDFASVPHDPAEIGAWIDRFPSPAAAADRPPTIRELLDRVFDADEEPKVRTGFRELDRALALVPGTLLVLAGRTASGKSALALQVATQAARRGGAALVVSMEMGEKKLVRRLLQQASDEAALALGLRHDHVDRVGPLREAAKELADLPILFLARGAYSDERIALETAAIAARESLALVVVDYLQLVEPARRTRGGDSSSREREVAAVARSLKALAERNRVVVLAVSQLSREHERQGRVPSLRDLRESGEIEHAADAVLFLHAPDGEGETGRRELILAKNRDGARWRGNFRFLPHRTLLYPEEATR